MFNFSVRSLIYLCISARFHTGGLGDAGRERLCSMCVGLEHLPGVSEAAGIPTPRFNPKYLRSAKLRLAQLLNAFSSVPLITEGKKK